MQYNNKFLKREKNAEIFCKIDVLKGIANIKIEKIEIVVKNNERYQRIFIKNLRYFLYNLFS